jgi:hypothetical protein
VIRSRKKILDAKLAAFIGGGFVLEGRFSGMQDDFGGRDPASARVLDHAAKRSARILREKRGRQEPEARIEKN